MLPREHRGDFQDFPAWRQGVYEALSALLTAREERGPVLVPMTVVDGRCFDETVGRLRADGHDVRHFTLLAHPSTVRGRLRGRLDGWALPWGRGETWAEQQVDRCLDALRAPEFGEHVWTDRVAVPEVAEAVAESAGLSLAPATRSAVKRRLDRARVSLAHFRLD
ncbi:ATP-binding protein [Streptomyces sp. HNM0574]|uniref:ATP-binding protein n=1 Tax=Streptomyces sp. HNM0574 TaxID=2714954 RepID=UPI00146D7931|nr:ATP-binding protein [Streptomyces sp. HNM0574]NLU65899.1 ATP-binding protein [Streptomyces sp. HNM0574]